MNTDSSVTIREPWLPLPPKGGTGGTNEMPWNYPTFEAYGRQFIRKLQRQRDGRRPGSSKFSPIASCVVEVKP